MKKIFSLFVALMAVLAINADNYYLGGINGSWPEPGTNASYQLTGEGEVLSATFARVDNGSELKVFVGEGWAGNEWAAAVADDAITPNGDPYILAQPAAGNLKIALAEGHYLSDATITYNTTTHALTLAGTDVDGSAEPIYYYLIGACTNNWSLPDAVKFEDVNGVLTANVAKLEGGFKIIYDRKWGTEYASNGSGVALGEAYNLQLGGDNLSLANPFAGYNNAVLTLDTATKVLTLVSGEFYVMENYWHIPGSKLGWNLNETTRFEPVEGKDNTYEFLAAEFGKDFKIVYGTNWEVEFGSQKPLPEGETAITWEVNAAPLSLYIKGDNLHCAAGDDVIYNDVTITIVVDYEAASVALTLEVEGAALEQIAAQPGAQKIVENGRVIIVKDGIRYTAAGQKL